MNNTIKIISEPASVDMADDWFDYADADHFWMSWRFNAFKKEFIIKGLRDQRLLEIGCGHGVMISQFESLPGITVDGCDLNIMALNKVKSNKGDIFCLNIFDKPHDLMNKYTGVLLMDVIEHVDDDGKFLQAACLYIKNSGLVLINVPALNCLYSKYDRAAGHKRRYSKKMLIKLLEDNGIRPLSVKYWGLFLLPVALLRKVVLLFIPERSIIRTGFRKPSKIINRFFNMLSVFEARYIKNPFIGTSILVIGEKVKK